VLFNVFVQSNYQSIFKLRYFNLSFDSSLYSGSSGSRSHSASSGFSGFSDSSLSFNYSCSNSLIRSLFIIGSCALILSFSKEGIIHSSLFICNSSFIFQTLVLGGFFTCCYLFRIYFLVFLHANFNFNSSLIANSGANALVRC